VRASILIWSTASGAILGVFVDATLFGVALLLSAVLPGVTARLHHRWLTVAALVLLAIIPIALAALGYLEGELKAI
jgi:hypothetical protein